MAAILVIEDDDEARALLKLMLTRLGHRPTLAAGGQDGLALAASRRFDLILLDLMLPDLDGFEVARRLRAAGATRAVPILVLTARAQGADRDGALAAGADGYLAKPFNPGELGARIVELTAHPGPQPAPAPAPAPPPSAAGRALTVLSLRGGVGRTTVAVTLAGVLSRAGRRVCLLDLAPAAGHIALQLRLQPRTTWAELPPRVDAGLIAQALVRHVSGIYVLAAPAQPARSGLSAECAQAVLDHLRSFFNDVVVDAAPVLDEATRAALGVSGCALLVVAPEVGSVETARGTLRALAGLGVDPARWRVILNHPGPAADLPRAAVEKALGRPADAVLPFDSAQAAALAHGRPLVFSHPQAPLPRALAELAARL